MTAITFSGLSSGIDTASLVSQLVAAERAPAGAIATRQSDLSAQKTILGGLSSALSTLGTTAKGMNLASELQPRTATSSDAHVTVAASSGAAATVHEVFVKQLARGQITSSRTFTSAAAGVLGAGSLSITTGTTGSVSRTINYTTADSLSDIAGKINDAGVGATASVLFDGTTYQLMVAATATGTAAAPKFAETGDGLRLSDSANVKVPAQDAIARIDGVEVHRGGNVISDAVAGLTLTLAAPHATTDASTTISVALDTSSLTAKLTALVTAYNAVNSALHAQLDYTGTKKGTNTLFGDSTLRQLQGALGSIMSSAYGPNTASANTLGSIGLTRGTDGALTLDSTKLTSALAASSSAISNVFVTGGFAGAMTAMTDAYTRAGDGLLASKSQSLTAQSHQLQTQADQINTRADALGLQLQKQFTALESSMSSLKSQSAFLTSIFG